MSLKRDEGPPLEDAVLQIAIGAADNSVRFDVRIKTFIFAEIFNVVARLRQEVLTIPHGKMNMDSFFQKLTSIALGLFLIIPFGYKLGGYGNFRCRGGLGLLKELAGAGRMVFGSDFPFAPEFVMTSCLFELDQYDGFDTGALRRIRTTNATDLLPRFKA